MRQLFHLKGSIREKLEKKKTFSFQVLLRTFVYKQISYWYFHRLHGQITWWFEGSWPGGKPVSGNGSECPHTHQCICGQSSNILTNFIQIWNAQLSQDFLSLHVFFCTDPANKQKRQRWKTSLFILYRYVF